MTLTELNEIKQNYKILELAVDFINPSYNISRAKHLDTARYIICTLTENGIPRTVKANEVARIRLQKPDRAYVYNDCDILDDGRVFITLTEQILAVEGNAVCDIQLTDEETGIIYSTKNFIINIDKTAVNNSVMESTNEFGALNSLIANNKKINDRLNANEEIRQTNEEQRIINETERQKNETDRQETETERVNAENARTNNENQRITNENTRQTNEVIRQAQETDRENNTATAILNAEKAVKKANDAANDLQSKLNSHHFVLTEDKGIANGVAELDSNGFIPSSQLPSYVDDVIEGYFYNNKFYRETEYITEITGETGKIYVDLVSNKTYRWSGSAFAVISETIALGETSSTAYRGDRGKSAYDHSQTLHAPANAEENQNTFSNVAVGSTTVSADSKTDTLTFAAGDNITITPDVENNKITISSTGGNGDSNHTHNYAGSDTPGGIAFEASSAYSLNLSRTNEVNFVKPNWAEPHTVRFGYKWTDGTTENLISAYHFDNGNKELAPVVASKFYQNSENNENPNISQVIVTNETDNYFRKTNLSNLKKCLLNGHSLSTVSTGTSVGYAKLFNITLTNDYANAPMKFYISRRFLPVAELEVMFTNTTKASTDFNYIHYHTYNGSAISIYYLKVSDGSWDIYIYTGVTYDSIELTSYDIPQYMKDRVNINLSTSFSTSAPSGLTQIGFRSYASIASHSNSLSTARNIKIGNETHSFDGTSDVAFTAANMNLAPQGHASASTTYGAGTASNYGHVKLSDNYTSSAGAASSGVAASSTAVYNAYNTLNTNIKKKVGLGSSGTYTGSKTLSVVAGDIVIFSGYGSSGSTYVLNIYDSSHFIMNGGHNSSGLSSSYSPSSSIGTLASITDGVVTLTKAYPWSSGYYIHLHIG